MASTYTPLRRATLLTFEDAWKRRAQIVEVTQSRLMPPWLLVHGEFADDRRLHAFEISLRRRWAEAGGPRGGAAQEPAPPAFADGWSMREPDLLVEVRDHLDLPVPVVLHAIYPHAHWLCRSMRGTATLPGGERRVLFGVEAWDFDWQDDYRFATPIALPAGTRLAMEYVFDNSEHNANNPSRPPRRVAFGQASNDAMATLTIAMAVADRADRAALDTADVARQLEQAPDAWNVLLRHARLARERGDFAVARQAIERARAISPGAADCALEAGILADVENRLDDARRECELALRLDPQRGLAHLQLGTLLGRQGRGEVALAHFEQALRWLPNAPIVHGNLGTANFQLGRL